MSFLPEVSNGVIVKQKNKVGRIMPKNRKIKSEHKKAKERWREWHKSIEFIKHL